MSNSNLQNGVDHMFSQCGVDFDVPTINRNSFLHKAWDGINQFFSSQVMSGASRGDARIVPSLSPIFYLGDLKNFDTSELLILLTMSDDLEALAFPNFRNMNLVAAPKFAVFLTEDGTRASFVRGFFWRDEENVESFKESSGFPIFDVHGNFCHDLFSYKFTQAIAHLRSVDLWLELCPAEKARIAAKKEEWEILRVEMCDKWQEAQKTMEQESRRVTRREQQDIAARMVWHR